MINTVNLKIVILDDHAVISLDIICDFNQFLVLVIVSQNKMLLYTEIYSFIIISQTSMTKCRRARKKKLEPGAFFVFIRPKRRHVLPPFPQKEFTRRNIRTLILP